MLHHRYVILSDIHGNLSALQAVLDDATKKYTVDGIIILGDLIDYGMRSNEVISEIQKLSYPIMVNLWGNHEKAVMDMELTRFSSDRGRNMLKYTASKLTAENKTYIQNNMSDNGCKELELNELKVLTIHGNIDDPFWGKLILDTSNDIRYSTYDIVVSGHIHRPFLFERYFKCTSEKFRNEKKTIFINPGSVGQPRNHNPKAQYLYMDLDSMEFDFRAVDYNIAAEQALYPNTIDSFYKDRLSIGV